MRRAGGAGGSTSAQNLPYLMSTSHLLYSRCLLSSTSGVRPFLLNSCFSDTDLLAFAASIYDAAVAKMVVQGRHIPPGPFLLRDPRYEALKNTIVKCLFGADKRLVDQAQQWGLKFMTVSDLNGNKVMSRQLHQSDVRDRVEDYFGVKRHRCRSSSPFSKERLPPVHIRPKVIHTEQRLLRVHC